MSQKSWLLARLAVALGLEIAFLLFILPWVVRDSSYQATVWQDFIVACAAFLVVYGIWPVCRKGGTELKIVTLALSLLPAWLLVWVVLQHFEFVPRWFS